MRFVCQICGYVYDDAKEKVPFSSLPDDWKCPLCGAMKSDFRPEETAQPKAIEQLPEAETDTDLKKLSAGQLSAIFSNLARGCEKQYKPEQAEAFQRLSDWLKSRGGKAADPLLRSGYR